MSDTPIASDDPPVSDPDDDGSLLGWLLVLAKHKTFIRRFTLIVAIIAAIVSLVMADVFVATARILPPQQSQPAAAALLGQLASFSGALGGAGALAGLKNPSDLYVAMLKSRTIADNLIRRFDLLDHYDVEYLSKARKKLAKYSDISAARTGVITIEVEDEDPKRAADMANAYVEELVKLTKVLAVTEASQRRLFFERQLIQAKENLASAEVSARQALERGGLVKVDDQGRAMVETSARLRAQIAVKEVQLGAMRSFATDNNPDYRLAQSELESSKRELAKIEGVGAAMAGTNANARQGIDSLRILRDVKYYEVMFELLAKQFELAKIDEAKDSTIIQVMDRALEPDRKSKPYRSLIVALAALLALCVAVGWAFAREAIAKMRSNPRQEVALQKLLGYLGKQ